MFLLISFIAVTVFGDSTVSVEDLTDVELVKNTKGYTDSGFFDISSYDQYSACYDEFFSGTKSQWETCCRYNAWSPNCNGKYYPYDVCYDVMDIGLAGVQSASYFSYTNSHWSDCCYNSCDAFGCMSEYCVSFYDAWVYWAWIAVIVAAVLVIALLITVLICCGCCGCCGCMACCRCCDPTARRLAKLQKKEEKRLAKEEAKLAHKQQLRDVEAGTAVMGVVHQNPAYYQPAPQNQQPVDYKPFPAPVQPTNPVYVYVNEHNTTFAPDADYPKHVDETPVAPITVQHQINQVRVLSSSEEVDELPKPPM